MPKVNATFQSHQQGNILPVIKSQMAPPSGADKTQNVSEQLGQSAFQPWDSYAAQNKTT